MINNRMNRARQTLYKPENNSGSQMQGNVKSAKERLQKVSFALVEAVLYLDAYPNCEKAKKYYMELKNERETLINALSGAGAPMSATAVEGNEWVWTNGPWPWEYEANV